MDSEFEEEVCKRWRRSRNPREKCLPPAEAGEQTTRKIGLTVGSQNLRHSSDSHRHNDITRTCNPRSRRGVKLPGGLANLSVQLYIAVAGAFRKSMDRIRIEADGQRFAFVVVSIESRTPRFRLEEAECFNSPFSNFSDARERSWQTAPRGQIAELIRPRAG